MYIHKCYQLYFFITGSVKQDPKRNSVKSGSITVPDRLFNDLAPIIHEKYIQIGVELGLEYQILCDELEVIKKGSEKAMKMLQLWRQSVDRDHFTYSELATALEKHGHKQAAHKFCYTEASSNLSQKSVESDGAPMHDQPSLSPHLHNQGKLSPYT